MVTPPERIASAEYVLDSALAVRIEHSTGDLPSLLRASSGPLVLTHVGEGRRDADDYLGFVRSELEGSMVESQRAFGVSRQTQEISLSGEHSGMVREPRGQITRPARDGAEASGLQIVSRNHESRRHEVGVSCEDRLRAREPSR